MFKQNKTLKGPGFISDFLAAVSEPQDFYQTDNTD